MSLSATAEKIRLAVTTRCKKRAPEFQIVDEKAHRLFDRTAEKFADEISGLANFWERAAFLRERVLKRTTRKLRGHMARLYNEYTAALLRGELASMEDEPVFKEIDPRIEVTAQYHAYLACTAGD
jgi:hypothetical protein